MTQGQSDITRHEAYTKAQGLNEFNSLTPSFDRKLLVTLHYCDIGGTRVLIDPQVKYKYGSNTPYCNIYDCGTCTATNGTSILTLTYSGGKLQVYPYFFNPAEFNSSFEKVVDNVRYISTSVETPRPTYESIEDFMQQLVTITINDIEFTKEANSIYFVNNDVKTKGEAWSPKHVYLYYVLSDRGKIIVTKDGVMQISLYIILGYGSSDLVIRKYIPVFMVNDDLPKLDAFGADESAMVIDNIPNSNYAYTMEHFHNECNFLKNCAINLYYRINGLPSNMININYNDYLLLLEITTTIEDINGIQHSIKFNKDEVPFSLSCSPLNNTIFTCIPLPDDHKITITLRQTPYIFPALVGEMVEIAQDANGPLIFPYICGPSYMGTIDMSMYGGYVYYAKRRDGGTRDLLYVNNTYKEYVDASDPLLLNKAALMALTDFNNSYVDIIVDGEPFYKEPNGDGILRHRIYGTDYKIIEMPDTLYT